MPNFNIIETHEISTGKVETVNDAFDATKHDNGARNRLGSGGYVKDSAGRVIKVRYVRINSTVPPVEIVGPVYWKDNAKTTVTAVRSESVFGDTINSAAGILLNVNITNGNFGFIQVAGFRAAMAVPAATAPSDALVSATGNQALVRVAAGTAPTGLPVAIAITAVAGGVSDVMIAVESF